MPEKILSFGKNGQLIGILSSPAVPSPDKPAVIILNSGALHRVGACRMSVLLARLLSEHGYYAFRFDFSGVGDSGFGGDISDNPLEARPEVKDAIEALSTQTGCMRFVLHGLCSGARDALAAALADERIVGLSMIDGYAFRTIRYHLEKLPAFLIQPRAWINFIRVRLRLGGSHQTQMSPPNEILELPFWPDYPPCSVVEKAFRTIAERNVRILATYTGSWRDEYNYERQFFDMFPGTNFGENVTVNLMPQANHVMTDFADQKSLRQAVLTFVKTL